jgi:hypothetical protein
MVEQVQAVETTESTPPQVDEVDTGSRTDGREERRSIRENLERGFADARKREEQPEEPKKSRDRKTGRFASDGPRGEEDEAKEAQNVTEDVPTEATGTDETPALQAPSAWSKEAREAWLQVPATVQAAVLKREQDTKKGVDELKAKYVPIDQALAPHIDALQRNGKTPADAISQLFAWFQALAANPQVAFPALAKSFNYDISNFAPPRAEAITQATPEKAPEQPAGEIPPAMQAYIKRLEEKVSGVESAFGQKLSGLEQTFQQQSMAKTQEILGNWAKDKPHYEGVRQLMAQFIQSGVVPFRTDGTVDLDRAYDMAVWANPEIRSQVQQADLIKREAEAKAKQEALVKARQDQADKARSKAVSAVTSAPGGEPSKKQQSGKGKSVRESLMATIEDMRN